MSTSKENKSKLRPSVLSFERKLEVSDALMYQGNWENESEWSPVSITKRQNRATQSSYGTKDDHKSKPNPVSSDSDDANLDHDKDTLKIEFTLRLIGGLGTPFACNEPEFEKNIQEKLEKFKEDKSLVEDLSLRYAYNIANGRFLWRNRVGAEKVNIKVENLNNENESFLFDAYKFSLQGFSKCKDEENLKKLASIIEKGLFSEDQFICLKIIARTKLGNGQHVFPSQEMNVGEKKKVLFQLSNYAAIHSVKIGNALRTIDTWYDQEKNNVPPIAVEPFGAVTQRGRDYRDKKNDLYTLMCNWVDGKEIGDNDKKYVVANFIRGGLFQPV